MFSRLLFSAFYTRSRTDIPVRIFGNARRLTPRRNHASSCQLMEDVGERKGNGKGSASIRQQVCSISIRSYRGMLTIFSKSVAESSARPLYDVSFLRFCFTQPSFQPFPRPVWIGYLVKHVNLVGYLREQFSDLFHMPGFRAFRRGRLTPQ